MYYVISVLTLFCILQTVPASSQDILKKTAKEICICLDETSKSDTLDLTPKQVLDKCTGAALAKNRTELAKKYDMGTISGVKALRDEIILELKQDCEQFVKMFTEKNPSTKALK